MKEEIREILKKTGALAVGFARAGEIDEPVHIRFKEWIEEGAHGEMDYLRRHVSLRRTTDNVLAETETVISLAFSYVPKKWRIEDLPVVAAYAYGDDYHDTLRKVLKPVVKELKERFGGDWRICIDSAPVAERFWALKCGIGKRGLNGSVIVNGGGALCFLVEILTTLELQPDTFSEEWCIKCGRCLEVCPGKALRGDGTMDARKCINYLTIEKKGEFSEEEKELVREGRGHLFGCDLCLKVCPHNQSSICEDISHFTISSTIENIDTRDIACMNPEEFKATFRNSPFLYAGYQRLLRNAKTLKNT